MDQKQYEVMSLIMAKGRKFLDEIYKLMAETGMLDQKYDVSFEIRNEEKVNIHCVYISSVELRKNYNFDDESWKHRMEHWNKDGKGWVIMNDPLGKSGSIQDDNDTKTGSDICGEESRVHPAGEAPEHDASPDNGSMWFRDDGGDPPMVCRGDMNGNMADG